MFKRQQVFYKRIISRLLDFNLNHLFPGLSFIRINSQLFQSQYQTLKFNQELQFFSILIINRQMTLNQKSDSSVNKDKNLILVAHNSELFSDSLYPRNSSFGGLDMRRNSSHNNLFPTFHQQNRFREEPVKRQELLTDAQRYAQQCLQYEKYLFDEKIRLIIHRMAILAYHNFRQKNQNVFLTFFIQRFLCTLSKKLLLNRFQLLFLQYVFEESKWRYDIDMLTSCSNEFKSFIHLPESQSPHSLVKNLQVYLLFCAYYSKKSLNDIANEGIFNHFFKTIHQRFKERYQEWVQMSGVKKITINLKILNSIFRKLTSFNEKEKQYINNYNLFVEEILEISPAYNSDKDNKGKRKKRKIQEVEKQVSQFQQQNFEGHQPLEIPPVDSPDYPSIGFRKKRTSYIDNLNGLDPVDYHERNNRS